MVCFEPDVVVGRCYIDRGLEVMILGIKKTTYFIAMQKQSPSGGVVQCSFTPIFVNNLYDFIAQAELTGWGNPKPTTELMDIWEESGSNSWKIEPNLIWNKMITSIQSSGTSVEDLMIDGRLQIVSFIPQLFDVRRN